ncbi:hypothetical protein L6259_00570 [Candidatus Parcubacteria bacterium]|nr:hypothetical protein [Patescibacteria group bacterium]MCG2693767.1 hypothetical protein [Candidatus Parcubacteria bacterium]
MKKSTQKKLLISAIIVITAVIIINGAIFVVAYMKASVTLEIEFKEVLNKAQASAIFEKYNIDFPGFISPISGIEYTKGNEARIGVSNYFYIFKLKKLKADSDIVNVERYIFQPPNL